MSEAKDIREEAEELDELEEAIVLDDQSAEMLLERIRMANEQYEKMEAWYEFQKEKAKAVRDRTIEWAERSLRAYFEMVPTKNTKTMKKYELPGGTLALKKQEPKYDPDDAQLVPWLKKNNMTGLVKVEESANWAELKKLLKLSPDGKAMVTEDGEIVPGVTVTPRDEKFTVKVK